MKNATFPALSVEPELKQAAEDSLLEGESISAFVEQSIRENIARRRVQREFIATALKSRDAAALSGNYRSAEVVFQDVENRLVLRRLRD